MSMNAQTRDAPMAGWPLLLVRTVAVSGLRRICARTKGDAVRQPESLNYKKLVKCKYCPIESKFNSLEM
jgi:hypothetical protein